MSNGDISRVQAETRDSKLPSPDLARPVQRTLWHNSWQVLRTIQARLRFIAILAIVGTSIAYWDTINAHYEKWTRPVFGQETVRCSSIEYACPMHPTLVRDHPDNCPLCGMPLSRRQKAEGALTDEALPPGVVSRIQLTPYRVAAAGIQTTQLEYRPLAKEITTVGFVEFDERKLTRITAPTVGKSRIDALYVNVTGQSVQQGQPLALVYSSIPTRALPRERLALWGIDEAQIQQILKSGKPYTQLTLRSPIHGHVIKKYQVEGEYVDEGARLYDVADLSTVWIEAQVYEDDLALLQPGLQVRASAKSFPDRTFQGKLAFVHPHLDAGTRTLKVRFDVDNPDQDLKPGMYATVTFQVPISSLPSFSPHAGEKQPRSSEQGLVLAVPERAVIDTGSRKIVYREAEPNLYEGVEVRVGPRCGLFYPVLQGLKGGDKVATAGSFLIDAETRLTAGAGSTYFGASGGLQGQAGRSATTAPPSMIREGADKPAEK